MVGDPDEVIPHIVHTYWGQDDLPFLRFLTLWSVGHLNPGWRIVLHEPERPDASLVRTWDTPEHRGTRPSARNYRPWLAHVPNLEIRKYPEGAFARGLSHVHRSDLLRWRVLAEEGGLWSDMDILYSQPLSRVPLLETSRALVCIWAQGGHLTHSIGFLGSEPGMEPYATAWAIAQGHNVPAAGEHYQALGNQLLARVCPPERPLGPGIVNLPRHVVYPYSWLTIREWIASAREVSFRPETIGVHWYAGDPVSTHYATERVHEDFADTSRPSGLFALVRHVLERFPLPVLSPAESGILSPSHDPRSAPRADERTGP